MCHAQYFYGDIDRKFECVSALLNDTRRQSVRHFRVLSFPTDLAPIHAPRIGRLNTTAVYPLTQPHFGLVNRFMCLKIIESSRKGADSQCTPRADSWFDSRPGKLMILLILRSVNFHRTCIEAIKHRRLQAWVLNSDR